MVVTPLIIALAILVSGLLVLFVFFLKAGNEGKKRNTDVSRKAREVKKAGDLIERIEKENPEMVEKIRSQFIADKKIESVKESAEEDISDVLKLWLSENEKE